MTTATEKYQGWANYQTWAVNLWIDNDEDTQSHWLEIARQCIERCDAGEGNEFAAPDRRPAIMLAEQIQGSYELDAEVWMGNQTGVFADLLNNALGHVEWHEIADSLLSKVAEGA